MVFVLSKKKLIIYAMTLFVALFTLSALNNKSTAVSALPTSNHIVILDPGHGGADGGASGADGTLEKDLNLKIALKVQNLLQQSGCTVFMTRSDDRSLSTIEDEINRLRKVADLNNRTELADKLDVEAFVSIHMNTFSDPQYFGTQVFYSSSPAHSKYLADNIQEEIRMIDPENTRETKNGSGSIFILNDVSIPSVVVECGFLSNEKDLSRLNTDEYQNQIAGAIYNGIVKFYSIE